MAELLAPEPFGFKQLDTIHVREHMNKSYAWSKIQTTNADTM